MGLSTGGGFRYGHVLICTWFFSNWPYMATSWKAITFRDHIAPCSLMEVTLSNFETAFCGPVANGVGPASSFLIISSMEDIARRSSRTVLLWTFLRFILLLGRIPVLATRLLLFIELILLLLFTTM